MVSLTTRVVLMRAAAAYLQERKAFSKEDIVKKINEIKYLSAQKKVPKLTLRKEIIHLENKLQEVFELEKKLYQQEKKESIRVARLKKELSQLKRQVAQSEDKDLHKKVETLSHLLGETLAQKVAVEEIALNKKISSEQRQEAKKAQRKKELVQSLLNRLGLIKEELAVKEDLTPEIAQKLLQKIGKLEEKLRLLLPEIEGEEPPVVKEEKPRHTLIFHGHQLPIIDNSSELALEKELPLPPPPKMEVE